MTAIISNSDLPQPTQCESPRFNVSVAEERKCSEMMARFIKQIEQKLDSVLEVNARLMKENIKLSKEIKRYSQNRRSPSPPGGGNISSVSTTRCSENAFSPVAHECSSGCMDGGKKKVMAERYGTGDEITFSGKGTYDAKELIKTFGIARFDKDTKSWILKPNKTLDFIREQLSQNFDYHFLE